VWNRKVLRCRCETTHSSVKECPVVVCSAVKGQLVRCTAFTSDIAFVQ
jgi:hypothetical protein